MVRSRARLHGDRQLQRQPAPRGRRVASQRAGCGAHGARLHQVGRHADFADALCRVGRPRVQGRDDGPDGACCARRRWRSAGDADQGSIEAADSEAHADQSSCRRFRRGGRGRQAAGGRRKSRDPRGPHGADPRGHGADDRAGRDAAGPRPGRRPQYAEPASVERRRLGR